MPAKIISTRAAIAGGLLATVFTFAADAASPPADRGPAKVADAQQVNPIAAETDDDGANCSKSRKRLWLEDEGWVVRKVTTCR